MMSVEHFREHGLISMLQAAKKVEQRIEDQLREDGEMSEEEVGVCCLHYTFLPTGSLLTS